MFKSAKFVSVISMPNSLLHKWQRKMSVESEKSGFFATVFVTLSGLNKLRVRRRACTQYARKEVFACTKFRAPKSIKTPLSKTLMLFKLMLMLSEVVFASESK